MSGLKALTRSQSYILVRGRMSKKLIIYKRDQRRYDKANVESAQGKALIWVFGRAFDWNFLEDWRVRDRLVGLSSAHSSDG